MDRSVRLAGAVQVPANGVVLEGDLVVPPGAAGLVVFAHGSGSSRFSPRNRYVAERLNEARLATLLLDLLTEEEGEVDERTGRLRFDIDLLAGRVIAAVDWARGEPATRQHGLGLFGASTGAAAALIAAAERPADVRAVVSRGGRPDLAGDALGRVRAATLLIVGQADPEVLALNRDAARLLPGPNRLVVIRGATHLFEEPGALEEVADEAARWFVTRLPPVPGSEGEEG